MRTSISFAALAAAWFTLTTAQVLIDPNPKACPCFTATAFIDDEKCPPLPTKTPCIVPLCARLTTTTIPGPNRRCKTTPTLTSLRPCVTACPRGCAVFISTETASTSCLPTAPTLPPPSSLLTSTKPTITPPPHSRPCYTRTVSVSARCPEDQLGCPPPDCIYLSTTTVPPGKVDGCESTPTISATRVCKGRCDGACGTQWVTETATAW